jgi:ribonucleoside-diphosphate reductase alpha chain
MLRVIRNHRLAAHGADRAGDRYENLKIRPVPIDHALIKSGKVRIANIDALAKHSVQAWDDALGLGEKHGYRNAQTTVIAPTGTIGLLMDCDTTGVEPDFALVKFKKLAGGGYFKIANESVRPALVALGYSDKQVQDIMEYLLGTLSLEAIIPGDVKGLKTNMTLSAFLKSKGLSEGELDAISKSLPGVFELGFAFTAWSVKPETLSLLGIDAAKAQSDFSFNLLRALGLSTMQIEGLNRIICGTQTIEGAPHLKDEHLSVFDCANKCGKLGQRFIAAEGHIRMMAAAQPFISGAISKTINLPNEATVEDIASAYRMSWELGLKANALYRDGSKMSQPLSSTTDEAKSEILDEEESTPEALEEKNAAKQEVARSVAELAGAVAAGQAATAEEKVNDVVHRPMRRRLSDTRRSLTHKFNVAGHQGYLTVGLYEDGKPGELFITMSKEGSTIGGLMDSLGTAISVALQYGVPVESLVGKFSHQRFEPAGMTSNRDIPFAKSLVDYIFRWMGMQFIPGFREQHAPRRDGEGEQTSSKSEAAKWAETPADRMKGYLGDVPDGNGASRLPADAKTSATVVKMVTERRLTSEFRTEVKAEIKTEGKAEGKSSALSEYMDSVSDAPPCDVCGSITVRSGTCHKCLNCGNSLGCS